MYTVLREGTFVTAEPIEKRAHVMKFQLWHRACYVKLSGATVKLLVDIHSVLGEM